MPGEGSTRSVLLPLCPLIPSFDASSQSSSDVIKTRLQVQRDHMPQHYRGGVIATARTILADEGARGFFSGLSPTLVGFIPTWMIYFSAYQRSKIFLIDRGHQDGPKVHLMAAVAAGVIADLFTNPLWVIKTRMQTQVMRVGEKPYTGIVDAWRQLIQEEGFRGLYKGLTPQLVGLVHVGIQFPTYERLKKIIRERDSKGELSHLGTMVAAFSAKVIASVAAYPHEILRSRLQFQHASDVVRYAGIVDCFRTILREEGARGFYKGLSANLLRVLPATTISFTVFEVVHKRLSDL